MGLRAVWLASTLLVCQVLRLWTAALQASALGFVLLLGCIVGAAVVVVAAAGYKEHNLPGARNSAILLLSVDMQRSALVLLLLAMPVQLLLLPHLPSRLPILEQTTLLLMLCGTRLPKGTAGMHPMLIATACCASCACELLRWRAELAVWMQQHPIFAAQFAAASSALTGGSRTATMSCDSAFASADLELGGVSTPGSTNGSRVLCLVAEVLGSSELPPNLDRLLLWRLMQMWLLTLLPLLLHLCYVHSWPWEPLIQQVVGQSSSSPLPQCPASASSKAQPTEPVCSASTMMHGTSSGHTDGLVARGSAAGCRQHLDAVEKWPAAAQQNCSWPPRSRHLPCHQLSLPVLQQQRHQQHQQLHLKQVHGSSTHLQAIMESQAFGGDISSGNGSTIVVRHTSDGAHSSHTNQQARALPAGRVAAKQLQPHAVSAHLTMESRTAGGGFRPSSGIDSCGNSHRRDDPLPAVEHGASANHRLHRGTPSAAAVFSNTLRQLDVQLMRSADATAYPAGSSLALVLGQPPLQLSAPLNPSIVQPATQTSQLSSKSIAARNAATAAAAWSANNIAPGSNSAIKISTLPITAPAMYRRPPAVFAAEAEEQQQLSVHDTDQWRRRSNARRTTHSAPTVSLVPDVLAVHLSEQQSLLKQDLFKWECEHQAASSGHAAAHRLWQHPLQAVQGQQQQSPQRNSLHHLLSQGHQAQAIAGQQLPPRPSQTLAAVDVVAADEYGSRHAMLNEVDARSQQGSCCSGAARWLEVQNAFVSDAQEYDRILFGASSLAASDAGSSPQLASPFSTIVSPSCPTSTDIGSSTFCCTSLDAVITAKAGSGMTSNSGAFSSGGSVAECIHSSTLLPPQRHTFLPTAAPPPPANMEMAQTTGAAASTPAPATASQSFCASGEHQWPGSSLCPPVPCEPRSLHADMRVFSYSRGQLDEGSVPAARPKCTSLSQSQETRLEELLWPPATCSSSGRCGGEVGADVDVTIAELAGGVVGEDESAQQAAAVHAAIEASYAQHAACLDLCTTKSTNTEVEEEDYPPRAFLDTSELLVDNLTTVEGSAPSADSSAASAAPPSRLAWTNSAADAEHRSTAAATERLANSVAALNHLKSWNSSSGGLSKSSASMSSELLPAASETAVSFAQGVGGPLVTPTLSSSASSEQLPLCLFTLACQQRARNSNGSEDGTPRISRIAAMAVAGTGSHYNDGASSGHWMSGVSSSGGTGNMSIGSGSSVERLPQVAPIFERNMDNSVDSATAQSSGQGAIAMSRTAVGSRADGNPACWQDCVLETASPTKLSTPAHKQKGVRERLMLPFKGTLRRSTD